MRMLEPGLCLSVGDSHRLIAQARRLRREYLRKSIEQLVSWIMRRWSRNRHGEQEATPPADTLRKAA